MLDIFFTEDLRSLMNNKSIVFMGDSNIRALYKDFLCLLERNRLIPSTNLRAKMENSVFGDKLKNEGKRTNGRSYREEREYKTSNVQASFYFLTRVYDDYVKGVLQKLTSKKTPDILILNSLLWDVTRWGTTGVTEYKLNLTHLLKQLKLHFPDCLVIWMTTPPISQEVRGGFLVQDLQFLKYSLRFHVVEANHFARKVVVENGFDLVDTHYHLKMQIHRRAKDGVHWLSPAVRFITNLLLTHISLAWNVPLPHRYKSSILAETLEQLDVESTDVTKERKGRKKEENKVQVQAKVHEDRGVTKAQAMAAKPDKENCSAPTPKRKRHNKQANKKFREESHHTFINRAKQKERRNRIRKWKATVPVSNHFQNPCYQSPHDPQHDSGYFPSPSEAYLSNESLYSSQRNITYSSPQCSRTVNYENYPSSSGAQSPWRHSLPCDTYYTDLPPLPSEPYPFSPQFQCRLGRTILPDPYVFPHAAQEQTLHPRIDFTSDDFMAY